jgi:hypothetical protein
MRADDPPVDWRVCESDSFRWGVCGDDLVAEWGGILTLRASRDGVLKALQPLPGASPDLVEKTRHGVAAAFLRALRHQHSLHASAVSRKGHALVCIGDRGLGKSTMAERLCRDPEIELLGDDMTGVEIVGDGAIRVMPSESAVWVMSDAAARKAPVRSVRTAAEPATLRYIVSLSFDDATVGVDIRELHGADAAAALLPSLIRFEKSSALWMRELDLVGELVARVAVVQARRPRAVSADAVADVLRGLLVRSDA